MEKWCNYCKQNKDAALFGLKQPKLDNGVLQAYCKECNIKKNKDWYLANKETHIKRIKKERGQHYKEMRLLIDSFKNKPCLDCDKTYPPYVMDFDHRNPKTKRIGVSNMLASFSIKSIQEEIAKCDLVCANCHRIRTHKKRCAG